MDGDKIWHTNHILHINPNWGDLEGLSFVVQFFFSSLGPIVAHTVKRQSRLSFHVFVAVPMGRAFFRCRLF